MHVAVALLLAVPLLLKASHLFDAKSGKLVSPGAVLVEGTTIVAAGSEIEAPAGAQIIDLGDATLLPGLLDAHTHLSHEGGSSYYEDQFKLRVTPPAEQAHKAAAYARRTLEAGFTTVRDLGSFDYLDLGLHNAIRDGFIKGPRMIFSLHPIGARGGHTDGLAVPNDPQAHGVREGVCAGADLCREAVRWQVRYGASVIKVAASGGVLSYGDAVDHPQLTLEEMSAIVHEAHNLDRKVAAHCHGDTAAKVAIKAGVDSLEHASFLKADTLKLAKERGIFIVPTLSAVESVVARQASFPPSIAAKARAAGEAHSAMMKEGLRLGVRFALGTDAGVGKHGTNARELVLFVERGMTPAQALRTGTLETAVLLGVADKLGSLEKGKLADVIAVPGDPLADIHATERVFFVMKEGEVVRADKRR